MKYKSNPDMHKKDTNGYPQTKNTSKLLNDHSEAAACEERCKAGLDDCKGKKY